MPNWSSTMASASHMVSAPTARLMRSSLSASFVTCDCPLREASLERGAGKVFPPGPGPSLVAVVVIEAAGDHLPALGMRHVFQHQLAVFEEALGDAAHQLVAVLAQLRDHLAHGVAHGDDDLVRQLEHDHAMVL